MQLRVLGFGLLENGDVGIGETPQAQRAMVAFAINISK
jgi:hypothetical protein